MSAASSRLVVLVSGTGTNLQALLDAAADPGFGASVVGVVSDRAGTLAQQRAEAIGVPTGVLRLGDFETRGDWDAALAELVSSFEPDLVILAGFLKLVGASFLSAFGGRILNTHNALLPSFPGIHGPRDALAYGVKVAGATLFVVDEGVDTGAIVDQVAVRVSDDDDEESLTERIKAVERAMLVDCVGRMAREGFHVDGRSVRFGPAGV